MDPVVLLPEYELDPKSPEPKELVLIVEFLAPGGGALLASIRKNLWSGRHRLGSFWENMRIHLSMLDSEKTFWEEVVMKPPRALSPTVKEIHFTERVDRK